ncbi:uncharacterized protein ANIA_10830 [Aspergillus nidulans FGSC A4]|uniref:Secreted protein n=1 Tax=Emericella nidulans (strain FGSC A4 / ATCC 38163 / CBS 112.46 / NRRL 194 / M139) TaxID=227321 RepID=C8V0S5_EMENI|nr:hypothetical protein [Aspergillus nidulans FGSC A4]CBF70952.1 TPA: hypothetical protein ANIA_10830 [Aspergillus nidulans FGSC A4]
MMVQPSVSSFQRTGSVLSFVLLLSLSACKHDDDSLFPEVQQCLRGSYSRLPDFYICPLRKKKKMGRKKRNKACAELVLYNHARYYLWLISFCTQPF